MKLGNGYKKLSIGAKDLVKRLLGYVAYWAVGMPTSFLNKIAGLEIFLLEPANEARGSPAGLKKSIWRDNFSYTHDYRFYAENAGFISQACEIIRPYYPYIDFPMHTNTVHYFYWARTKTNTPY